MSYYRRLGRDLQYRTDCCLQNVRLWRCNARHYPRKHGLETAQCEKYNKEPLKMIWTLMANTLCPQLQIYNTFSWIPAFFEIRRSLAEFPFRLSRMP